MATVGSITGPHHFQPIKVVVSEIFVNQVLRGGGGTEFSSLSGVLVQKQAFQKGDGSLPIFQYFVLVVFGCMLLLDCKKEGGKKTVKQGFFCHQLLERRKREKRRDRPEVKNTPPFLHCFGGP